MGIFGQYGNQRTARLFQRQGDRPAAERPGQLDGPDFYGFRCMLQFTAGAFAVGSQHGPEVFLIGPVQTDVRCVGWLLLFCGVEWTRLLSFLSVVRRRAVQAGLCFREGLIVESGDQTTSEDSFWNQSASRGRSSHGRPLDAT